MHSDDYATQGTRDIAFGFDTKSARKCLPKELHRIARLKLNVLDAAKELNDLRSPPGNHLEAMKGNKKGFHSIRINNQWRIIFRWEGNTALEIEICDYH